MPEGKVMDVAEAWRRSRLGRCACEACFYCGRELDVHQHDHYPVPRRAGGSETVPACPVCHDLKDRVMLRDWDLEAAFTAIQELFVSVPDAIKGLPADEVFEKTYRDIELRWKLLSPLARVMYAKMRSIYEDRIFSNRTEASPAATTDC